QVSHKWQKYQTTDTYAILNPIIYFICETTGIRMTTASESGAFLACIPVVALIMSSLILKEWPSRWQVVRCRYNPHRYHYCRIRCGWLHQLLTCRILHFRFSRCLLCPLLR
ncbi:Transporter, drug/metabolite exporter family, partial [Streptococcus thermophilus CNCM I-1630]